VFGLSGFLGKLWAQRGLEKQRQEYTRLNLEFSHQLDLASRRLQIELDAIGHLHRLRTESEFQKIRELWERIAVLRDAFGAIPKAGFAFVSPDKDKQHKYHIETSQEFTRRFSEARELLIEETLAIPKEIADAARDLLTIAQEEVMQAIQYPDPFDANTMVLFNDKARADFFDARSRNLKEFTTRADRLEATMRQYLRGNKTDEPPKAASQHGS
jgi:hypothetical protein